MLNFVGRYMTGLGEQGFRAKLRQVSSLASIYLLSTTAFVASQFMQTAAGAAGLVISEGGGLKSIPLAGIDFFKGYHQALMPSPESRKAVSWAAKNGYISADYAEMFGARHAEGGFKAITLAQRAFGKVGQAMEKEAVRIPYFLMQMEALKSQYKGEGLYEAAAERTDHYMVNYSRSNQAMMWQRLGGVGEGAKLLKQFSNNFLGQLTEYVREAKNGDPTPLVMMMAASIMTAGLAGNIAVQTTDDMIRAINAIGAGLKFNWNFPTTQERIMKSGQSDALTFGLGSTILGRDISSSVAQNSIKGMFNIPVVDLSINTAEKILPYVFKAVEGKDTTSDRARALLALAPPAMREGLKDIWVKNGIVPDINHNMEMIYKRNEKEQGEGLGRALIGRPSLNEARKANIVHYAREALAEQMADVKSAANVVADKVINGEQPTMQEFEAWVKEGGDPRNLNTLVNNRLMAKTWDVIDRQYMKKGNSGVAAREAIKEEAQASKNLHKQSLSDNKSDARGNVGAALPFDHMATQLDENRPVKEVEGPKIRGADKRKFFHDMPVDRIRRHQQLMGAI
jgi:hypothetical protein